MDPSSSMWQRTSLRRRGFLRSTLVSGLAVMGGLHVGRGTARAADDAPLLEIVVQGAARAVVVIADDADLQTREAAELLVTYVAKSTGATLTLLTESELPTSGKRETGSRIYVGDNRLFEPFRARAFEDLDPEGYVFWPVGKGLVVAGPTSRGTEYGVLEFLEEQVGVRWLLPGVDGEDVPSRDSLTVPLIAIRDEPVCAVRTLSPFHRGVPAVGAAQGEWYRRNRGHVDPYGPGTRMRFLHNLHAVVPVAKYYDDHPEWYPGGRLPKGVGGWQPSMTAEGTVEAAAAEITAWFDANPDETVFSLGINDGGGVTGGWVEGAADHPDNPGRLNTARFLHMSDLYFAWVNRVVELVLAVHPDKWFGCLAYHTTWEAPSFEIHPRVVPYLCHDRMTWAHPEVGAMMRELTDDWAKVSNQLGWYEYSWGMAYTGPRVYFRQLAESASFLYERGVKYHHSEFYPSWSDGPKGWLFARHLWDESLDVEAALADWYDRAVGPGAAGELAAYYDIWEEFWTTTALDSDWFDSWRYDERYWTNYLPIGDHNYLSQITDDLVSRSRAHLEAAVRAADSPVRKRRAELILHRFEFHEATVQSWPRAVPREAPQTAAEALALLDAAEDLIRAAIRRDALAEEFAKDAELATPALQSDGLSGVEVDGDAFGHLADWLRGAEADDPVHTRVQALITQTETPMVAALGRLLLATATEAEPLNANGSFELGSGNTAQGWDYWIGGSGSGSIKRTTEHARSGEYGLLVQGVGRGGPNVVVTITKPDGDPGLFNGVFGLVSHYWVPAGQEGGVVMPHLALQTADGDEIAREEPPRTLVAGTAGRWATACKLFRVDQSNVGRLQIILSVFEFGSGDKVYFDDVALHRLQD